MTKSPDKQINEIEAAQAALRDSIEQTKEFAERGSSARSEPQGSAQGTAEIRPASGVS